MDFPSTYKLGLPFLTLKKASGYGDDPKSRSSLSIWPKINCKEKAVPPPPHRSRSSLSPLEIPWKRRNCPMAVQKLDDRKGLYIDRQIPSVSLLNIYSRGPGVWGWSCIPVNARVYGSATTLKRQSTSPVLIISKNFVVNGFDKQIPFVSKQINGIIVRYSHWINRVRRTNLYLFESVTWFKNFDFD